jgi:hypothetical protein
VRCVELRGFASKSCPTVERTVENQGHSAAVSAQLEERKLAGRHVHRHERTQAYALLGPAARRSALRKNRRLARAKRAEQVNAAMAPRKG